MPMVEVDLPQPVYDAVLLAASNNDVTVGSVIVNWLAHHGMGRTDTAAPAPVGELPGQVFSRMPRKR